MRAMRRARVDCLSGRLTSSTTRTRDSTVPSPGSPGARRYTRPTSCRPGHALDQLPHGPGSHRGSPEDRAGRGKRNRIRLPDFEIGRCLDPAPVRAALTFEPAERPPKLSALTASTCLVSRVPEPACVEAQLGRGRRHANRRRHAAPHRGEGARAGPRAGEARLDGLKPACVGPARGHRVGHDQFEECRSGSQARSTSAQSRIPMEPSAPAITFHMVRSLWAATRGTSES